MKKILVIIATTLLLSSAYSQLEIFDDADLEKLGISVDKGKLKNSKIKKTKASEEKKSKAKSKIKRTMAQVVLERMHRLYIYDSKILNKFVIEIMETKERKTMVPHDLLQHLYAKMREKNELLKKMADYERKKYKFELRKQMKKSAPNINKNATSKKKYYKAKIAYSILTFQEKIQNLMSQNLKEDTKEIADRLPQETMEKMKKLHQQYRKLEGEPIPNFKDLGKQRYYEKYERQIKAKHEKIKKLIDYFAKQQRREAN
ncbi:MAG: hypothetical protein U9O87_07780 [Verrucomicrobiota bacterium]|nr:hypothetical protein [Verrucomicrobiota bacterium]